MEIRRQPKTGQLRRMARGDELTPEDRRNVLAFYLFRYTRDHVPAWVRNPRREGTTHPVQFDSDADWLAHTWFAVRADGRLDGRYRLCDSRPTWPDNPELRRFWPAADAPDAPPPSVPRPGACCSAPGDGVHAGEEHDHPV